MLTDNIEQPLRSHLADTIDNCIKQISDEAVQMPREMLPDALDEGVKRLRRATEMLRCGNSKKGFTK